MKVLIACEYSGKVRDAFINAGHDCISCDLLEGEGQYHKDHYKGDVFDIINNTRNYEAFKNIDLLIAFPPCTHLAVSGARYFEAKRKDGRQQEGIDFFMKLINAPIDKICVENPVPSKMAKLPKYDQIIQPYQFGHDHSKKTCLWLKNLPKLKPTKVVEVTYITTKNGHRYTKGWYNTPRNSVARSRTFIGIAKAMADQWSRMSGAYKIRHCIHCGKKDFENFEEVLLHVKHNHMVIGSG